MPSDRRNSAVNPVKLRLAVRCCAGAIVLACAAPSVHALPADGEIVAGQAEITQSDGALTVDQTTSRLAIDWTSFSIGTGESVTFRQPTAQSIALNRVLGQDPSAILASDFAR
jgi:large exoprotein involved in heme utilization and adhesion